MPEREARTVRLDRYIEDLLAAEDLRASTQATYASALRTHIKPLIGDLEIETIGTADIRGFFADMRRNGVGPGAVDMVYRLLSKTFLAAMKEDPPTRTTNPMSAVKRSKPKRSNIEPPTPEELEAIIAKMLPRYRALTELMAWTGLRIGEAAGLMMSSWNQETRKIRVEQQSGRFGFGEELKTDAAYRDLYLPAKVNHALKLHVKRYPPVDGRIFSTNRGTPVINDRYYKVFQRAKRRAGITRPLSPHKLRHHAITAMGRAGVPPKAAQAAVGHTTAALTLDIYTHINDDDLMNIADRMDGVLGLPPLRNGQPAPVPV